jgi:hypothetical protein
MSDATVTPDICKEARDLTGDSQLFAKQLARLRAEEPHLFKAAVSEAESILCTLREANAPPDVVEAVNGGLALLTVRVFTSLRIGSYRLWGTAFGLDCNIRRKAKKERRRSGGSNPDDPKGGSETGGHN